VARRNAMPSYKTCNNVIEKKKRGDEESHHQFCKANLLFDLGMAI
jgi:hypothetical protein